MALLNLKGTLVLDESATATGNAAACEYDGHASLRYDGHGWKLMATFQGVGDVFVSSSNTNADADVVGAATGEREAYKEEEEEDNEFHLAHGRFPQQVYAHAERCDSDFATTYSQDWLASSYAFYAWGAVDARAQLHDVAF